MKKEAQLKHRQFLEKFSKQVVYFKNTYENAVIKSLPKGGDFVKFKGAQAFEAVKGSAIITDALLESNEITKEEYENF